MSEDRLLSTLGRAAREEEEEEASLDERWDRLAAGTASAAEVAELEALAERSSEAREIFEAFRPLGPGFEARAVAAAKAQLPKPLPRRRPVFRLPFPVWVPLGAAGALAASLLLFFRPLALGPLPLYAAVLSAGDQELRGGETEPGGVRTFSPGSLLTLRLVPQETQEKEGSVEIRCCIFLRNGEAVSWQARVETSSAGIVRVRGTLGEDFALSPGDWTVWAVVGHRGKIPRDDELVATLRAGVTEQKGWRAVSKPFRVEGSAQP